MSIQIGRLKEVNIKDLWIHEQYNFSNWLAKEENITLLNEAIDLTLTDIEKEVYVGSYRCDLVATDETTGIKVIIENQLEATNHEHLGKIITYASGLGANVIIWVVKQAREEHRSAIEWLNNNTVKNISFFLIEIHAYKIGDSLPAPKFEVIEEPNDFLKSIKNNSEGELNKSKSERLYFWTEFNQFITDLGKPFNIRKATTNHSYSVAIGTSEAHINVILINKEHKIGIEIHIKENKDLFDQFYINKEEIEKKLGFKMDWQRLNNKKKSRIIVNMYGLDFDNKGNYKELMTEIIDKVVSMRSVFREYL
ncbi:DUF4268 domain-containing protein [Staphylococcus delphini]|uniref:DUF4268 domain-containing protein n=1 Tax=Staphylococcus delphini TaxID=53344 RepID=UPI000BBC6DDF|nr:DUF4268 domain-containing protein [Staphylococcus delphini]PCF76586.1 hypothetical protein B4W71_01295 [Staphylococcus delphini]